MSSDKPKGKRKAESDKPKSKKKPKKDKPATGGKVKPKKEKKDKGPSSVIKTASAIVDTVLKQDTIYRSLEHSSEEFEYDILKGSLTEQVAAQMSKPQKKQTWELSATERKALADKFTAQIMGVTVGNSTVSAALEHWPGSDDEDDTGESKVLKSIRADVNRCVVAHQKELTQLMKCD